MKTLNHMRLEFDARPENESFARIAVAAFAVPFNPTMDVLSDIRTAVSEAVTNVIVHAYREQGGNIVLEAALWENGVLSLSVSDRGCGIPDVEQAMQPFYTTQPEKERSGMGFAVMQSFMDSLRVESAVGQGTTVRMEKLIRARGN
ncbi:MAG: anti-sigma F factor [Clostridia bacterium]|nr:anti-sigma F factor [Clostridia bacterium]